MLRAAERDRAVRAQAAGAGRAPAPGPRAAILSRASIQRLQRSAGNRAVGRLLAAAGYPRARRALLRDKDAVKAGISVNRASQLSAGELADRLKKNRHVPGWLKKSVGSRGATLTLADDLKPPADQIWEFVDPLEAAFKSGQWEITTARSTIEVTKDADGKETFAQRVIPDLAGKERVGVWMKTGGDAPEFSPRAPGSNAPEIITGWTLPDATTDKREKVNLIVVVTEIEVTAPNGRRQVFKPSPGVVAESILHEIAVHAGRHSQGLPDTHDEHAAAIKDIVDQVGGFFRDKDDTGELKLSPLSEAIFKFVGHAAAVPTP